MAIFRGQTLGADSVFDSFQVSVGPSPLTLSAEAGAFSSNGYPAALVIFAPPGVAALELEADIGFFAVGFSNVRNRGSITLSADAGVFTLSGYGANLLTSPPVLTFPLNDGSGTVARCLENPAYNAAVIADDWVTTTDNDKRWPINEGAGALLNETETGDDTYDATIQNFIEGGWPD